MPRGHVREPNCFMKHINKAAAHPLLPPPLLLRRPATSSLTWPAELIMIYHVRCYYLITRFSLDKDRIRNIPSLFTFQRLRVYDVPSQLAGFGR